MNPANPDNSIGRNTLRSTTADVSTPSHNPLATVTEELALNLANELRQRWGNGEQPPAEEFLRLHPDLMQSPEAAVELIYEEYCLRVKAGHKDVEQDILRRFPSGRGRCG